MCVYMLTLIGKLLFLFIAVSKKNRRNQCNITSSYINLLPRSFLGINLDRYYVYVECMYIVLVRSDDKTSY